MQFPQLAGMSLTGHAYALPDDLNGMYRLLLIAYQPNQQREINTWQAPVEKLCQQFPDLHYYEIAAMWTFPESRRQMIIDGMRMGMLDPATRARVITVFTDLDQFNRILHLTDTEMIYALLLDRDGLVLWRAQGRYTGAKGESLQAQLNAT